MMNHYELEAMFSYTQSEGESEPIGDFVDRATDHLAELGLEDLHVVLDKAKCLVVFGVMTSANSEESVETTIGKVMGTLRTAFHKCGAMTPGWPTPREMIFGGVNLKPVVVDPLDWIESGHKELISH